MASIRESVALRYKHVAGAHRWQPESRPWQSSADNWLVAHDLFHHSPSDTGTWEQEVETLGAEYYINYEGLPGGIGKEDGGGIARSAASVTGLAFEEGIESVSELMLPEPSSPSLGEPLDKYFVTVAASAAYELKCLVVDDSPESAALLEQASNDWPAFQHTMRRGYLGAKQRFPDRTRVREAWDAFISKLRRIEHREFPLGACITVQRTGYEWCLALEPFRERTRLT